MGQAGRGPTGAQRAAYAPGVLVTWDAVIGAL